MNEFLHALAGCFRNVDGAIGADSDIVTELELTGGMAKAAEGVEDLAFGIEDDGFAACGGFEGGDAAVDDDDASVGSGGDAVGLADVGAAPGINEGAAGVEDLQAVVFAVTDEDTAF